MKLNKSRGKTIGENLNSRKNKIYDRPLLSLFALLSFPLELSRGTRFDSTLAVRGRNLDQEAAVSCSSSATVPGSHNVTNTVYGTRIIVNIQCWRARARQREREGRIPGHSIAILFLVLVVVAGAIRRNAFRYCHPQGRRSEKESPCFHWGGNRAEYGPRHCVYRNGIRILPVRAVRPLFSFPPRVRVVLLCRESLRESPSRWEGENRGWERETRRREGEGARLEWRSRSSLRVARARQGDL